MKIDDDEEGEMEEGSGGRSQVPGKAVCFGRCGQDQYGDGRGGPLRCRRLMCPTSRSASLCGFHTLVSSALATG